MIHSRHRGGGGLHRDRRPCGRQLGRSILLGAGIDAAHRLHAATAHVHAAHVHSRHLAHVHAHILHGGERALAQTRHLGGHSGTRCKRSARHSRPVDRLADQRIGFVLDRSDNRVIGFGDPDLELVDFDRHHVLTIGLHNRQPQPGDPDVERGHRRSVDHTQAHPLAGREQRGPVVRRAVAVNEKGLGSAGGIGDVCGIHPHPPPHPAVLGGLIASSEQPAQRLALKVEVAGIDLHRAKDRLGRHLAVIG